MDLGPHAVFILSAYAAGFLVLAALIAWVMIDYRTQRRLLSELEKSGVVRRSDQRARDAAVTPAESA